MKGLKTGGRKRGTPNKSTAAIKQILATAFEERGGVEALLQWSNEHPTEFYKLWAKLLPHEVKAEVMEQSRPPRVFILPSNGRNPEFEPPVLPESMRRPELESG